MIRTLAVPGLCATLLFAQIQDPAAAAARWTAEAVAGLGADDPVVVADHAALIARHRLVDAAAPLQTALATWQTRRGTPARLVRLLLVDALWSLPGTVPKERLEPLLDDPVTRVPAFLLLGRDVEANREVLARVAMAEDPKDLEALAAALLLLERRIQAPGLVAHLCRIDDLPLHVLVRDDRQEYRGGWVSAVGPGVRQLTAPTGFPPLPQHRLLLGRHLDPALGAASLVVGRSGSPVLHLRTESAVVDTEPARLPDSERPEEAAIRRLQMTVFSLSAATPELEHTLRWHDAARLRADVAELHADQSRRLAELVATLRQDGWLAADELVGFRWPLRLVVRDERGDRSVPLPPIPLPAAAATTTSDLRPRFAELGLPPRGQGARPTCSIFTTVAAFEFAMALVRGRGERLSVEYANWAANAATGRDDDGDFFHCALAGFEQFGACPEELHPYAGAFANTPPPAAALVAGGRLLAGDAKAIAVRWIRPIGGGPGLTAEQFAEIVRTLSTGIPVAVGAAHSRVLVGYRDDAAAAGGGVFLTLDSGIGAFGEVTAEYVRGSICDAFAVEPVGFAAMSGRRGV